MPLRTGSNLFKIAIKKERKLIKEMPQVDFYIHVTNPINFATKLVQTVYRHGSRLLVLLSSELLLRDFSNKLWCLSGEAFLPHCTISAKEAHQTPILLACRVELSDALPNILLNLTTQDLSNDITHFERILEIVTNDESSQQWAQERLVYYQTHTFNVLHHDMSKRIQ